MKSIMLQYIQPKPYLHHGYLVQPETVYEFHAEIIPKKAIRIFGKFKKSNNEETFDRLFSLVDRVVYWSDNYFYVTSILSIGKKAITLENPVGRKRLRLDFYRFCHSNWNFPGIWKVGDKNSFTEQFFI